MRGKDVRDLFVEVMTEVSKDIAMYEHVYNSPTEMWNVGNQTNKNGEVIQFTIATLAELYTFLYRSWNK